MRPQPPKGAFPLLPIITKAAGQSTAVAASPDGSGIPARYERDIADSGRDLSK